MFSKFLSELQQNWKSGITVGVVSLPLSIALSIASGAGPIPGVITGIWACLFAALFASNNYNIIGAAGALTTLLATIASVNLIGASGSVFILPFLAILVGLVILLVYVLKLDRYLTYIPSSVMYGFAAGVAILIALTQLNDALGLVGLEKHPHFIENMKETVGHLSQVSVSTLGIFIIFLTTLLVWKKYIKKVPGVIPVAILGILFGYAVKHLALPFDVITLGDRYTLDAALYQALDMHSFLAFVQSPSGIMLLVKTAVVVALVAILETLITAKLADKLTKTTSNAQIELRGLGLANIASGLFGGLPATGVFIRTGLNAKSGATSRMSAGIAAITTAILALIFLPFFRYIPMVVIAAILFNTAIGLIEVEKFHKFWTDDKKSFFVCCLVAIVTIIHDASIGILVGVVLALLFFIDKLSKGECEVTLNSHNRIVGYIRGNTIGDVPKNVDIVVYSMQGILVYLVASNHAKNITYLSTLPTLKAVVIRMRDCVALDVDGVEALGDSIEDVQRSGKEVLLSGPQKALVPLLKKDPRILALFSKGKVFEKTEPALVSLGFEKKTIGKREKGIQAE